VVTCGETAVWLWAAAFRMFAAACAVSEFDASVLTVHDGKGQKDRTVPLPEKILPQLRKHLESLKVLHQRDFDRGYGGAFLVNASEKKYPKAVKDFVWEWFLLARQLTLVPDTEEYRHIACMRLMCKRRSNRRSARQGSVSGPLLIPFVTVLPAICSRRTMIFERLRSCLGIAMSGLQ
jgi:hypothetical protein